MDDLFSTRRPKDFKAGFASGLKSVGKGFATGVAGLVAAPIMGAREGGCVGAAKGVAVGVAGAVVLPVTGLGVGTAQGARLDRFVCPPRCLACRIVANECGSSTAPKYCRLSHVAWTVCIACWLVREAFSRLHSGTDLSMKCQTRGSLVLVFPHVTCC